MRTHFPGAVHEVRSAARFPLSAEGVRMAVARKGDSQEGLVVRHNFFD